MTDETSKKRTASFYITPFSYNSLDIKELFSLRTIYFIRTLRLKFFQKQEHLKKINNIFNCAVFLSCIKIEMFTEVPLF